MATTVECERIPKFVGLAVGCGAFLASGSLYVFSVYQGYLKATFNYTQTEVEVICSGLNIGLGLGFIPGYICDRFGPKWTSGIGFGIVFTAYLLIWSSTKSVPIYSGNSWLLAVYFFLAGIGALFLFLVSLLTNIVNFGRNHAGKVAGLLNAMIAGSNIIYPLIYYNIFTDGDIKNTSNQDLPEFFVMITVCYAVIGVLCVLFLRFRNIDNSVVPMNERTNINISVIEAMSEQQNLPSLNCSTNSTLKPLTLFNILRVGEFQCLLWTYALTSSVTLVHVNNVTVVSRSVHLDGNNVMIIMTYGIAATLFSLIFGFLADFYRQTLQKTLIILAASILCCLSQICVAAFANTLATLILASLLVGSGMAMLCSVSSVVMYENFAGENFGRNWGLALSVAAMLMTVINILFGKFYDIKKTNPMILTVLGCLAFKTAL